MFVPSKYQENIFNWVLQASPGDSLVVEALAGTGKTTTLEKTAQLLDGNVIFLAFNAAIAKELKNRLPNAEVRTYHSAALGLLTANVGRVQVDEDRDYKVLKNYLRYEDRFLISPIRKLVGMVKNNLTDDSDMTLDDLAQYYNVDVGYSRKSVYDAVRYLLNYAKNNVRSITFDDMIWLPNVLDFRGSTYDWVLVDELQDTNKAQIGIVERLVSDQSRIIGVGDTHQSIYAFRGADSDAIDNFVNNWNADRLPLSITYRNPKKVVELVRNKFDYIPLECPDWADDGIVEMLPFPRLVTMVRPNDMVLCRTNADLVAPAFQLIRQGYKVIIRGRDIGKSLMTLVAKMESNTIPELIKKLAEYKDAEVYKLIYADKVMQAQSLEDRVETIIALCDGVNTIYDLKNRIETIFSDDNAPIVFSSIHKAKGLEADRIFILRPDLLPHPMAKKPWEKVQESNLEYVAYTRAKKELYIMVDMPDNVDSMEVTIR